jgi:hypothetical protein
MLSEGLLMPNTVEKEIDRLQPTSPACVGDERLEQHTVHTPSNGQGLRLCVVLDGFRNDLPLHHSA